MGHILNGINKKCGPFLKDNKKPVIYFKQIRYTGNFIFEYDKSGQCGQLIKEKIFYFN